MTTKDIISRAAYNIGDEMFKEISQDEYLRMLRRTYRDFCEKTKILRNVIQFQTTANVTTYKLYGNDENGKLFGDNFLGLYYVSWSVDGVTWKKAFELDLDTVKNTSSQGGFADLDDADAQSNIFGEGDDSLFFTINYFLDALYLILPVNTPGSLYIKLWYYELPSIATCLPDMNAYPLFDQKYHDKLVLGLELEGWKRRYVMAVAKEKSTQVLKILSEERQRVQDLWTASIEKVHQEVMALKDDTIPLQVMPGTPFDQWNSQDTNNEQDEDLF